MMMGFTSKAVFLRCIFIFLIQSLCTLSRLFRSLLVTSSSCLFQRSLLSKISPRYLTFVFQLSMFCSSICMVLRLDFLFIVNAIKVILVGSTLSPTDWPHLRVKMSSFWFTVQRVLSNYSLAYMTISSTDLGRICLDQSTR